MSSMRRLNSMPVTAAGFPWLGKPRSLRALQVAPQRDRLAEVDVLRRAIGIAMQHQADDSREGAGHVDLTCAQQRDGAQAEAPRRDGRELGVEVRRAGEDAADEVLRG